MMEIKCETLEQLTEICAGLVVRGITFKAFASNLTIECTGGF